MYLSVCKVAHTIGPGGCRHNVLSRRYAEKSRLVRATIDARRALDPSAPVIRIDLDGKADNHIFDRAATWTSPGSAWPTARS